MLKLLLKKNGKKNAHSPSLFDKMNCVETVKIFQKFDKKKKKREAARQNTNDIWKDR